MSWFSRPFLPLLSGVILASCVFPAAEPEAATTTTPASSATGDDDATAGRPDTSPPPASGAPTEWCAYWRDHSSAAVPVGLPMQTDRLVIDTRPATPGQSIELRFPGTPYHGVGFFLDRDCPGGWQRSHCLVSDGNGGTPTAIAADAECAFEAVGIAGPGPDTVVLPTDLPPGDYRICTALAEVDVCARLAVIRAPKGT